MFTFQADVEAALDEIEMEAANQCSVPPPPMVRSHRRTAVAPHRSYRPAQVEKYTNITISVLKTCNHDYILAATRIRRQRGNSVPCGSSGSVIHQFDSVFIK